MGPAVTSLITALKQAVPLQLRSAPDAAEYLEGVLVRDDLKRCQAVLRGALGPPVKEFGQAARFDRDVRKMVDGLGGVRTDQCLFFSRADPQGIIYAALWPWGSDPARITLKVGMVVVE